MLKVAESNSQTLKFEPVLLAMEELIKIYDASVGTTDSSGEPGEFLSFYANWAKSLVYKLHSGFIRVEPYPELKCATIHGMFFKNPFKDRENIKSVLDYYLSEHPDFTHLECHVDRKFRGVVKLVAPLATSSTYRDGVWIFHYGGI